MSDKLKSSWELAMERLAKKGDAVSETKLSGEQKERIQEVRTTYKARIAEREIMFKNAVKHLMSSVPPADYHAKQAEFEKGYRADVAKLRQELENEIQSLRDAAKE